MSLVDDDTNVNDDVEYTKNKSDSSQHRSLFKIISSSYNHHEDDFDSKDLISESSRSRSLFQIESSSESFFQTPSCSSSSRLVLSSSTTNPIKPVLEKKRRQGLFDLFGNVFDNDDAGTQYEGIYRSIPMSPKEKIINLLSRRDFVIKRHYIPFKYNHFYPIGCTNTHAFGVIKKRTDGEFYPVVLCFSEIFLEEPYEARLKRKRFVSPWKQRLEGFDSYLGGCVFASYVCIITHTTLAIFRADWSTMMINNQVCFEKITCCTMNHDFLVIVGQIKNKNRMIIYRWGHSSDAIIQKNIVTEILSVKLVIENENTLLYVNIQKNNGYTYTHLIKDSQQGEFGSFVVLKNEDSFSLDPSASSPPRCLSSSSSSLSRFNSSAESRWTLEVRNKFILSPKYTNTVMFSKTVQDGSILQFTKKGISYFNTETVFDFPNMVSMPIDSISYGHGIYAVCDVKNTIRFYDSFKKEISVVKYEDILAPMIILERQIPPIQYYYDSISLFSDKKSIAMLLSYGCLCVITPRN